MDSKDRLQRIHMEFYIAGINTVGPIEVLILYIESMSETAGKGNVCKATAVRNLLSKAVRTWPQSGVYAGSYSSVWCAGSPIPSRSLI